MEKIDYQNWDRRVYYEVFESFLSPHYAITVEVDVTDLLSKTKAGNHSFYAAFAFVSTHAMNSVRAFRYRKVGGDIVVIDPMGAGMAVMSEGDSAYRQIAVPICDDFGEFEETYRKEVADRKKTMLESDEGLIGYSTLPWFSFTAMSPCVHGRKYDNMTLLECGKYFERDGRTIMPLSISANHMFVQGNDVGDYLSRLNENIAKMIL